jgi:hypothetical protein
VPRGPLTTAQGEEVGLFLPLEGERVRLARFAYREPAAGGDATGIMTLFDVWRWWPIRRSRAPRLVGPGTGEAGAQP